MPDQAILVVSFGTSYLDTLEKTIQPIEAEIGAQMPGRTLRRAFTSGMILRKLEKRDGLHIDNVPQALDRLLSEGVDDVVVQPTHIMNGEEYAKLQAQAAPYRDRFRRLAVGAPLLTTVEDYHALAGALVEALPPAGAGSAHLLMGHGSEHYANAAYCQLEYVLHDLGRTDVVIGAVEGYPGFGEALRRLRERRSVSHVRLAPLMVVAGDHARNDLAGGDEDSWASMLTREGYQVSCDLRGLGEYPGVRALFVRHALEAAEG